MKKILCVLGVLAMVGWLVPVISNAAELTDVELDLIHAGQQDGNAQGNDSVGNQLDVNEASADDTSTANVQDNDAVGNTKIVTKTKTKSSPGNDAVDSYNKTKNITKKEKRLQNENQQLKHIIGDLTIELKKSEYLS